MDDKQAAPARVNWRGADLRGVNMAGVNLESADLRATDLSGANFTAANLRYADLRGATLQGTNFQNANLYGAKMQGIEAYQADFRGADLRLANLAGAYHLDGAMMPPPARQPSPSEVARDKRPHVAEQSQDQTRQNDRERSRGR